MKKEDNLNNLLRLNLNENKYALSNSTFKKITLFDRSVVTNYPNYNNIVNLIAKYINLGRENILVTNGANQGLDIVISSLFKNKSVIVPTPTYYPIYFHLKNNNAKTKIVHYKTNKNNFVLPLKEILTKLKNANGIIIINPNNPLGTIIPQKDLLKIIKTCNKLKKFCVVDEAYYEFYGKSCKDLIKHYKNLIVIRSFSKFFGLAGLRLGYIIAHKCLISKFKTYQGENTVNSFAIFAGETCLRDLNHFYKVRDAILKAKNDLYNFLVDNNIKSWKSNTNFLLIKHKDSNQIYKQLYEKKILVSNTSNYSHYDNLLKNTLRITVPIGKDLAFLKKTIIKRNN
ncbi:MAG: hypothetical protein COT14_02905 [Candidatus Diapherotrites archaeon CG08_land_8_20_14_0_20_30_16]|nr:MAG: hypothetical protein COT14_02905 [Candidatus Diapherotrites archaeon CG08_land_8_20_14_0_20_30_16]